MAVTMSCSNYTNQFKLLGELEYLNEFSNNEQFWNQFDVYVLDSPEEVKITRYKCDDMFLINYQFINSKKIIVVRGKRIFHVMGHELKMTEGGDLNLNGKLFVKFSESVHGRTTHSAKRNTSIFIPPS